MRAFVLFSFLLISSCGAREEIVVSRLDLSHRGWDTLQVFVDFASKTVIGGTRPVTALETSIIAFNASYDTLYAGSDSVFAIADIDLGNSEKVLVEVCGTVRALKVCEQTSAYSSPKRVTLIPDIEYPLRSKVFEGEYKLPFIVERLEDEAWILIKPSVSLQGFLKAYVEEKEEEAIYLPFSREHGGFNLAHHNNYKDFKFYLDSALLDEKVANVKFDVFVDMEGIPEAVSSISKPILLKTEEEHKQDLALFVEDAARRIVEYLSPYLRRRENTVYIDRWSYNSFKKMYSVDVEIEWRGSLFNRSTYRLAGQLDVYESGERAQFKMSEGNRRARQRWESRVNGQVLDLNTQEIAGDGQASGRSVDNRPFIEEEGLLVIEAEHFESSRSYRQQSWSVSRNQLGYNDGGAVVVTPDRGTRIRSRYNKRSPELTYQVEFTETGKYYVWLRVWADDNNSNSVHLGIDGAASRSSSYIGTESYKRWVWTQRQLDSDDEATVTVTSPGEKRLNLWMREDGLYVDRIILTKDRRFSPRDVGPAESLR